MIICRLSSKTFLVISLLIQVQLMVTVCVILTPIKLSQYFSESGRLGPMKPRIEKEAILNKTFNMTSKSDIKTIIRYSIFMLENYS